PPAKERRYRLGPESARRSGRPLRDLPADFFSSLVTASCSCLCACSLLHRPWGRVYRAPPSSVRADRILREGAQQTRVLNSSAAGPDHRVPATGGILTASGDLAGVRDRFGFRLTAGERREFGGIAIVDDGCVAGFGGRRDTRRLVDVLGFFGRIRQLGHGVLCKVPHDVSACVGAGTRCPYGEVTADVGSDAVFGTVEPGQLIELAIGMPEHRDGSSV